MLEHYDTSKDMNRDLIILWEKYQDCLFKLNDSRFNMHSVIAELHIIEAIAKKAYHTLLLQHIEASLESDFSLFKEEFKRMTLEFEAAHHLAIVSESNKKEVIRILKVYSEIVQGLADRNMVIKKPRMFSTTTEKLPLPEYKKIE